MSFTKLKRSLATTAVLESTSSGNRYGIDTDVNDDQLRCVLLKEQEDKTLRTVKYLGRMVTDSEPNYDTA